MAARPENEQRFRQLLSLMPAAVYCCDAAGVITYFNEQAAELWGRTPRLGDTDERFCGSEQLLLPDGATLPHEKCPMALALREGSSFRNQEINIRRPDGSIKTVLVNVDPIRNERGDTVGAINAFHDVTVIKKAGEAERRREKWLADQGEALELAMNDAPLKESLAVLIRTVVDEVGQGARAGFYLSNDEGTALHHVAGMSDDYAKAVDGFTVGPDSLACGLATHTGNAILTSDVRDDPNWQDWLWMAEQFDYRACWSFPIRTAKEQFIGTLAVYSRHPREAGERDIQVCTMVTHTASIIIYKYEEARVRGLAEQALRKEEERFRALTQATSDVVYRMDPDWASMRQLSGREFVADTLEPSETWLDTYIPGEDQPRVMKQIRQAIRKRTTFELEHRVIRVDGSLGWAHSRAVPIFDEQGRVVEWFGAASDVTQRKNAEEDLRLREMLMTGQRKALELAINDAPLEGSLGAIVETAIEVLGGDVRAAVYLSNDGKTALHHVVGICADYAEAVDGFPIGPDSLSCGLATHTGTPVLTADVREEPRWEPWIWLAERTGFRGCWSFPIHSKRERFVGKLAIYSQQPRKAGERDVQICLALSHTASVIISKHSEAEVRKQAERSLLDASRAKDKFLAVLSHELRTPLTPVLITAAMLQRREDVSPEVRGSLGVIHRNIELQSRLIDDLLDLSRITSGKLRLSIDTLNVNELVGRACEVCRPNVRERGIRLFCDLQAETPEVAADAARLQQVFWNLLNNAIKFTAEGGQIFVRTESIGDEEERKVRVTVRDTGVGIAQDDLGHIFEAFEQAAQGLDDAMTARRFGGMGLGLAICRALIEQHNGTVRADSSGAGKGSTFTVELPALRRQVEPRTDTRLAAPARLDAMRLLVVEDHPDTADAVVMLLRHAGHTVEIARNGTEALRLAAGRTFDAMISDLGLPDMTGYQLLGQLTQQRPIKAIAMSGYGMEEDINRSRLAGFCDHVVKPASIEQLEQALRSVAMQPD